MLEEELARDALQFADALQAVAWLGPPRTPSPPL
jgi:hypothetical protein